MHSVMWSEHCSLSPPRCICAHFGETTTDEMKAGMLAGIGETPVVGRHRRRWAVTFGSSHRHPSLSSRIRRGHRCGRHRPRASWPWARGRSRMDSYSSARCRCAGRAAGARRRGARHRQLRQLAGPAEHRLVRRALIDVGQCALRRGTARTCTWRSRRAPATRSSCSAPRTGLDGIGRVSVCWPATPSPGTNPVLAERTPVGPGGRPFVRRCLGMLLRRLYAAHLVVGIQDPRRTPVLPHRNWRVRRDGGMAIELDRVPLRAANMQSPAEVLSSESQERMCAGHPGERRAVHGGVPQMDVLATVIGEGHRRRPAEDHLARRLCGGRPAAQIVAHEGPVYQRRWPESQDELIADSSKTLRRP